MSTQQNPAYNFRKILAASLPVKGIRVIYSPSGDVTYKPMIDEVNVGAAETVAAAEMAALNNQPRYFAEITSITGTHIYVGN